MKLSFTHFPSSCQFDQDYANYFYYNDSETWYRVELLNWKNSVGEREAKEVGYTYCVTLDVIHINSVSCDEIRQALDYVGSLDKDASEISPKEIVWSLFEYGLSYDRVISENGNNYKKLLAEARGYL